MATATATGNIFLWDLNYDQNIKSRFLFGSYQSACQGLSWNNKDTNLLLSCFQEGVILLWVHDWLIHLFKGSQTEPVRLQMVPKQLFFGRVVRQFRSIPSKPFLLYS